MEIEIVSASFLALIPVVMGVTGVIKKLGLSTKYAPLCSLVLGVIGAALLGGEWTEVILSGVIVGLSASGLYSGGKAMVR